MAKGQFFTLIALENKNRFYHYKDKEMATLLILKRYRFLPQWVEEANH